jgi:hypothetical protein
LFLRQYRRPREGVVLRGSDQSGTHRVLYDIPRDIERIVAIAKNTLKVTLLPKPERDPMTSRERRMLLGQGSEGAQIGGIREPFHKQVEVIRHVTVRKNRELLFDRGTQKPLMHVSDKRTVDEVMDPLERADREEILLRTAVPMVFETTRTHRADTATSSPGVSAWHP